VTAPRPLGLELLTARPAYLAASVALDRPTLKPLRNPGPHGWGLAPMRSTLDQFPLPWVVQERSTCFVVRDKTSQPLAYIHFEDKSGRLSPINQLTRDEALCIAVNIAKLPELLETRNAPTETLRPAVPDAHQPSCFGLEEERGANWKGSGGAAPSIKEVKPSL